MCIHKGTQVLGDFNKQVFFYYYHNILDGSLKAYRSYKISPTTIILSISLTKTKQGIYLQVVETSSCEVNLIMQNFFFRHANSEVLLNHKHTSTQKSIKYL